MRQDPREPLPIGSYEWNTSRIEPMARVKLLQFRRSRGVHRGSRYEFHSVLTLRSRSQQAAVADLALPQVQGRRSVAMRLGNRYMERVLAAAESDTVITGPRILPHAVRCVGPTYLVCAPVVFGQMPILAWRVHFICRHWTMPRRSKPMLRNLLLDAVPGWLDAMGIEDGVPFMIPRWPLRRRPELILLRNPAPENTQAAIAYDVASFATFLWCNREPLGTRSWRDARPEDRDATTGGAASMSVALG